MFGTDMEGKFPARIANGHSPVESKGQNVKGVDKIMNGHAVSLSPRWNNKLAEESEDWFHYSSPEKEYPIQSSRRKILREEGRRNMEKVAGSREDWFEHVTNGWPSTTTSAPLSPRSPRAVKYRELNPDSNDWYRHEHHKNLIVNHKPVTDDENEAISDVNELNVARVLTDSELAEMDESLENRRRAEYYRKRNLMGSPGEWYKHEHDWGVNGSLSSATTPRKDRERAKKGREVSENWYDYNKSSSDTRNPAGIKVKNRKQDETFVKDILQMNANLGDLRQGSRDDNSTNSLNRNTAALMQKFLNSS